MIDLNMKKKLILVVLISCYCFAATAQDCGDNFLGTKTLYKAADDQYTPVPAGYEPVFINHVGRHGARHLTKDVNTTFAYSLLLKADSAHALTVRGSKLKEMTIALQKIENGNTKSISAEGKDELKGLGERMFLNYKEVFKNQSNLSVAITKEIRTKQSADAFLKGLKSKLNVSAPVNEYNDDADLRFYDLAPSYKRFEKNVDDGEASLSIKKMVHFDELNTSIAEKFFSASYLVNLDENTKEKFVSDIFGFTIIVYSLKAEIVQAGFQPENLDFKSFFNCDEVNKLALFDSVDENLKKGPATDNNGIQVRVAVPLLVNFINTTDEFINGGKVSAQLRFAHAETIAPFAALLEISSADKATKDFTKLNEEWKSSDVIPLSANIQWVFYKKPGSTNYVVKVLLNEKEAHITGLNKKSFPYYNWNDFRAFFINKLNHLNVKLTDDMSAYLANLK